MCKNLKIVPNELTEQERNFIAEAFSFLEKPGFLIRAANKVGRPVETVLAALPEKHQQLIQRTTQKALRKGLELMIRTLPQREVIEPFAQADRQSRFSGRIHSAAAFGLGAAGGLFGVLSLPVELPATTSVMLRSIAATASEFGMNLQDAEVQLECLYILSLGSPRSRDDDALKSTYWASRAIFSRTINEAAAFMAGKSAAEILRSLEAKSAPMLIRFLGAVASRFEIVVSEKFLSEVVPVVGAAGGGLINAAFTDYFSRAARYHFGLRALENRHGRKVIEDYYLTQRKDD